jgi:hypothetical protein
MQIIYIIISIFLIILLAKIFIQDKLEHLTTNSDEAIQNVASLYNKDQLTIGNLNVTSNVTAESLNAGSLIDRSMNGKVKDYVDVEDRQLNQYVNTRNDQAKIYIDNKIRDGGKIDFKGENWNPDAQMYAYGGGVFNRYIGPSLKTYCSTAPVGSLGVMQHANTNYNFGHIVYKLNDTTCIGFPQQTNVIKI